MAAAAAAAGCLHGYGGRGHGAGGGCRVHGRDAARAGAAWQPLLSSSWAPQQLHSASTALLQSAPAFRLASNVADTALSAGVRLGAPTPWPRARLPLALRRPLCCAMKAQRGREMRCCQLRGGRAQGEMQGDPAVKRCCPPPLLPPCGRAHQLSCQETRASEVWAVE